MDNRSLVKLADRHLDETLQRMEAGTAPIWESQAELGRTLLSLASGALVLSMSLTQFFADKLKHPSWTWLLPTAWTLFTLTVLIGASRQAWSGHARSFRAYFEPKRGEIRAKVWALEPGEDLSDRFDAILRAALEEAGEEPQKAVKVHDALTQGMFWAFAFGIVALLLFALKNLPF